MARQCYEVDSESLGDRTVRFSVSDAGGPLSWRRVLAGWRSDPALGDCLGRALARQPFVAFRFETPAMTASRLDSMFECVVVADASLDGRADPVPFAGYFRTDRDVVRFHNLGGDAIMVVPCPRADEGVYVHFAAFLRGAPREQQRELWREVSVAMSERLGEYPVWLSTAGGGVAWLHVRLDDRPKYYAYSPYCHAPEVGR
ncbi:DUF6940 family protein [Wenzhouxiangella sp. EGI_FJ10409]|uniref:DUF6940 family protein n=1 Tax=Wenzhouxiangella sp. EGI_FJ10409 TaxID=3243767 RepID=UPI0035DC2826